MENGTAAAASTTMTAAEMTPPSVTFIKLCLLWTALHKSDEIPAGCRSVLSEEDVFEIRMSPRDGIGNILDRLDDGSKYYNWWKERHHINQMSNGSSDGRGRVNFHYRYTSRSLSIIGVLGGVVLILLIVALSTCIKNRRNILMEPTATYGHQESFARQILIDHIRHLSQTRRGSNESTTASSDFEVNNSPPPSYDDAVKAQREGEEHECSADGSNSEGSEGTSGLQPPSYIEALEREEAAEVAEAVEEAAAVARRDLHHYVVQIEVSSSVTSEDDDGDGDRISRHEDHAADGRCSSA